MALTDTALKALKPRDRTYTITDDRGLYLEVFPTGGMVGIGHMAKGAAISPQHYRCRRKQSKLRATRID